MREEHARHRGDLLFFAAPDTILEPESIKQHAERAAQFYEKNASRVVAVRPGGKGEVSQTHIAWSEKKGVPGVPSSLYLNGRIYTFLNGGILFCRDAATGKLVFSGRMGEAPGWIFSGQLLCRQIIESQRNICIRKTHALAFGSKLIICRCIHASASR